MNTISSRCSSCLRWLRVRRSSLDPEEFRIILLGKTGNGKSSLGNKLVGNEFAFKTGNDPSSVTEKCQCVTREFDDKKIRLSVVDTPGFFDTRFLNQTHKNNHDEIGRSLSLLEDGPHAFFIVLQCGLRFTNEEKEIIDQMEKVFPGYIKYSIIIFTHIDQLENNQTLENYLKIDSETRNNKNPYLIDLINECGKRYYGINNKETNKERNKMVLIDLIEKIQEMLISNGTEYYRCNIVGSIPNPYLKNTQLSTRTNSDGDNSD